jgi:Arc/MetJ-type ribon-helix-helix transcriptional regulator
MSKQIVVRLPDGLVDFVDDLVDSGTARNRAVVVTRALERERRRALAERDAGILAYGRFEPASGARLRRRTIREPIRAADQA